jgi:predicted SprT family Zn-dependent metalloprotease
MILTLVAEVLLKVRMVVPPIAYRRVIDQELARFFHSHRPASFNRAVARLCRYYNVRRPRVYWYEYLDWGKTAGKTYEDGRIHIVHPENWKRGRVYNTERMWVQMIYHEMAHYLFWTDAERKADMFMRRMVNGVRQGRAARTSRGIATTRRAALRARRAPRAGRKSRKAAPARARNSSRRARRSKAA